MYLSTLHLCADFEMYISEVWIHVLVSDNNERMTFWLHDTCCLSYLIPYTNKTFFNSIHFMCLDGLLCL